MNFSLATDAEFRQSLEDVADEMVSYQDSFHIDATEERQLLDAITPFEHTTAVDEFTVGGVDGSGDYPSLQYADSFVYLSTANAVCYRTTPISGLTELAHGIPTTRQVIWLPAPEDRKNRLLDQAFSKLMKRSVFDVVSVSDYSTLKARLSRSTDTVESLIEDLIRPPAHDAANLGVQLRSVAELGCALQLILLQESPRYVFIDTTMSLPFVSRKRSSLFLEHAKRLCCVEARSRGIGFFALSKSHGLPRIDLIESLARDKFGFEPLNEAEHWFLRIPADLELTRDRQVPPHGAVSYLVRFHRGVPVLRLDMDVEFWNSTVHSSDPQEQLQREMRIFQDLDYCGHDQRCYGYPYPIKAGHDRASLTRDERLMIRKMIEEVAAKKGIPRTMFESASIMTGHE